MRADGSGLVITVLASVYLVLALGRFLVKGRGEDPTRRRGVLINVGVAVVGLVFGVYLLTSA